MSPITPTQNPWSNSSIDIETGQWLNATIDIEVRTIDPIFKSKLSLTSLNTLTLRKIKTLTKVNDNWSPLIDIGPKNFNKLLMLVISKKLKSLPLLDPQAAASLVLLEILWEVFQISKFPCQTVFGKAFLLFRNRGNNLFLAGMTVTRASRGCCSAASRPSRPRCRAST